MLYRGLALLIIFTTISLFAFSQPVSSIEVVTNLTLKGQAVKSYKAAIHQDKIKAWDTIEVKNLKPQFLPLQPECTYTIFFLKDTFPAECILVDTHLPPDLKAKKYRVYVNVEIDPHHSQQTDAGEDFPSAIIKYNKKQKNFEYVKQYHKQVHK